MRGYLTSLILFAFALAGCARTGAGSTQPLPEQVRYVAPSLQSAAAGYAILYRFGGGSDGAYPVGSLLFRGARLFGTTFSDGSGQCERACGTVFKVALSGSGYVRLYEFRGDSDGAGPYAALTADANGALYGTTGGGGNATCSVVGFPLGCGTVFELAPNNSGSYVERVLYRFRGGTDGANPRASVIVGADGKITGTTFGGGKAACNAPYLPQGCGTVFRLTPIGSTGNYKEAILYRFQDGSDGSRPSGLTTVNGALYGTTKLGGTGNGTVFKLTPSGPGYTESILYRFKGGSDGAEPDAGLSIANGALFGTTFYGGDAKCNYEHGCGTIFRIAPSGKSYNVVYRFKGIGVGDGANPTAGLVAVAGATLYGTAFSGGSQTCNPPFGCGTVFSLATSGTGYKVLHRFAGGNAGKSPQAGLLFRNGALYGAARTGGDGACDLGCGAVYRLTP